MPEHLDPHSEDILDDTVHVDFDSLDALEMELAHTDRGLDAARARAELERTRAMRSRSVGTRSLDDIGEVEMEEIDMEEIGEVEEIEEDTWGEASEVFSIEDVDAAEFDMEDAGVTPAGEFTVQVEKQALDLSKIVQEPLPDNEYFPQVSEKRQIYLHHTVSPGDPMISIRWWKQDRTSSGKRKRVATFVVIAGRAKSNSKYKDGEIYQCFSSSHWAHHLFTPSRGNRGKVASKYMTRDHNNFLNKVSIGLELSSWGPVLPLQNGNFAPYDHYHATLNKYGSEQFIKREVKPENVIEYPDKYRGFRYFEKYTPAQIESTRQLLVYLCDKFDIPTTFTEDIFDLHEPALRGDKGIFAHTSVRADKSDCHPQPELIAMLKGL